MKLYLSLFFFLIITNLFAQQNNQDLTLSISGYKDLKGTIFIAVYNSEQNYMNVSKASYLGITKPAEGSTSYTFHNVPDGVYAVTIFYDENGNGTLDTNTFGIPKEQNAFSNNVRGLFGPPKFDKSKFTHRGKQEISIVLK
jgi:uncharacterized protein (DUF2141 family)